MIFMIYENTFSYSPVDDKCAQTPATFKFKVKTVFSAAPFISL